MCLRACPVLQLFEVVRSRQTRHWNVDVVSRAHFDPTVELPVDKLAGLELDYVLTVWDNATLSVPYGDRWHNISEFGPDTP